MEVYQGKSVFGGIAIGRISVHKKDEQQVKRVKIENPDREIARYRQARQTAMEQLQNLYQKALKEVGEANAAIFEIHQMMLEDEDYLEAIQNMIRTEQVGNMASKSSANPKVRAHLLKLQRTLAEKNDVVMDGRDIGTVVLPDAQVKIFLTASPEARAERRYKELVEKGMDAKYDDILNDVITRDYNDTHRKTAPLKPAEGCITVDTTELDFEQSVEKIISVIKENI